MSGEVPISDVPTAPHSGARGRAISRGKGDDPTHVTDTGESPWQQANERDNIHAACDVFYANNAGKKERKTSKKDEGNTCSTKDLIGQITHSCWVSSPTYEFPFKKIELYLKFKWKCLA